MFRRFAESVSNAVSNVTSTSNNNGPSTEDGRVAELASMGFREAEARHALRVSNGDMQRATEWLLSNGTPVGLSTAVLTGDRASSSGTRTTGQTTTTTAHQFSGDDAHDDDMQRAIQASLAGEVSTTQRNDQRPSRPVPKSAASYKAGQAATMRNGGIVGMTTTTTNNNNGYGDTTYSKTTAAIASHPKVQVPKRLSQHDKEDVILRCATRIAPHPMAVDTLIKSLKTIQAHPYERKYQTVDTTTPGFQRSLNAPGVLDFFKAMNFFPTPGGDGKSKKILQLSHSDAATFYLGISALEQVQQTNAEYSYNKAMLLFERELDQQLALADIDMDEAIRRSEYMRQCPSEPHGPASQITVEFGIGTTTSRRAVSRKFEGDDTLADVVHWLGSHASIIPKKLLNFDPRTDGRGDGDKGKNNNECWYLVDRNHSESPPYNVPDLMDRTLQYIGCWPSGRLAVVPVLKGGTVSNNNTGKVPSSRGLGAGPAMEH